MFTEKLTQAQAAAAYAALAPALPEVLRLGSIAALEGQQVQESSGLHWCNVPSADLLKMDSELANCEKLRRSLEALEAWNLRNGRSGGYAPTAGFLASLAGIDEAQAAQWLARPAIAADVALLMAGLNIDSKGARLFNTMKNESERKPSARSVIKWSEALYGPYEWESE